MERTTRWTKRTLRSGPPSTNARVVPSTLDEGAGFEALTSDRREYSTTASPGFDASVCHVTLISSSRVPKAMCTPEGA